MKSPLMFPLSAVLALAILTAGCSRDRSGEATTKAVTSDSPTETVTAPIAETPASANTESQAITTEPAGQTAPAASAASDTEPGEPVSDSPPRMLPTPGSDSPATDTMANANVSTGTSPDGTDEMATEEAPDVGDDLDEEYEIDPEIMAHIEAQRVALRRIADTYAPPPGAKQLGEQPDLWVDLKAKRVYVDGYVAMNRGPLEMLACPVGTKEHESVIAVFAKSSEVHAALLAIGAQSGTPVRWIPEFLPPTGQTISVWVAWRKPQPSTAQDVADNTSDEDALDEPSPAEPFIPSDEFMVVDARKWVRSVETQTELAEPWVFAGSTFWSDPEDGIEHYSANAGDMICVSNFSTAMLDVPFNSSAETGNLMFEPFTERIPERGTPVRLILVPQPIPRDEPAPPPAVDPTTPPDESILPISEQAKP
ncbi:YdjY domain-containing protein [Aporhodopirellula aestuarii]|uniref:YdjY domain-containing protein n=1 Tax=Aporhodopirellula aestuarii TaxID=2950107 RepID=A0ABT0U3R9_9BACT|nr:YdjY domain-containing protein [Aporhodopirellula aestuarii]MCM2371466.1 YdjY domain-containing protein [Aporhodopirellula aestuarii]